MIPEFLKARIELKYGKQVKYPKDCEGLALDIHKHCNEKISATTIKRLFGIISLKNQPRSFTLDVIANYAGFKSWKAALEGDAFVDNSYFENCNRIIVKNLIPKQIIIIKYNPDRMLKLCYEDNFCFNVIYSEKSKLMVSDTLKILRLELGYPIVCEKVIRNGIDLGTFIGGKEGGITHLSVE